MPSRKRLSSFSPSDVSRNPLQLVKVSFEVEYQSKYPLSERRQTKDHQEGKIKNIKSLQATSQHVHLLAATTRRGTAIAVLSWRCVLVWDLTPEIFDMSERASKEADFQRADTVSKALSLCENSRP